VKRDARGGGQGIFAVADRREHKEQKAVDAPTAPRPSWHCRNSLFRPASRRGSPLKSEGVGGVFEEGSRGRVPLVGSGKARSIGNALALLRR